jgi:hypothetical protein
VKTEWIKREQHQPMAHRPPSSESAHNALCKPDQRNHIADVDKVFINRLPSLKDIAVTVFSFN